MKILIVTHYFTPHIGGIEIVAYNQAKELVRKGHEVTIVTSAIGKQEGVEKFEGIRVVRVKAWNYLERSFDVPYPVFAPSLITVLNREVMKHDVIHAHGALYAGSFLSSLIARRYKKPFFLTEHVGFVGYKNPIINLVETIAFSTVGKMTVRNAKKIFVLNKKTEMFVSALTSNPIALLHNGVDIRLFKPAAKDAIRKLRRKYNLPLQRKLVLFVGRFVEKKGIDVLVNAKTSEFDLVLVGQGKMPANIHICSGIHVINSLPQKNLAELYQACDVFVLPSTGEGFPLSIQEAMASGLPIVTSKENISLGSKNKHFVLATKLSTRSIQNAVIKITKNIKLLQSMGEAARNIALKEFSWTKHAAVLEQVYAGETI